MIQKSDAVSCKVVVPVPPERAFELFTARFGKWWPRDYTYSREVLEDIAFGSAVGDWCHERGPHGFRCDWGRILEWTPSQRLVFTWQISPKSVPQPDPAKASTVTINFAAAGSGQTCVAVEHSQFERHGAGAAQYQEEMASAYGWPFILQQYAAAAS